MANNDRSRDNTHLNSERRPWLAILLLTLLAIVAVVLVIVAL